MYLPDNTSHEQKQNADQANQAHKVPTPPDSEPPGQLDRIGLGIMRDGAEGPGDHLPLYLSIYAVDNYVCATSQLAKISWPCLNTFSFCIDL